MADCEVDFILGETHAKEFQKVGHLDMHSYQMFIVKCKINFANCTISKLSCVFKPSTLIQTAQIHWSNKVKGVKYKAKATFSITENSD